MALPIALIAALTPVIKRLINKKKPLGKTNVTTAAGGTLMGTALLMTQQPDETTQVIGYFLGVAGFIIALIKDKND